MFQNSSFLRKKSPCGSAKDVGRLFWGKSRHFWGKKAPAGAPKTRKTFNYKKTYFFVKKCRRRQRQRLGRLLITIASLNRTPVRALEAFIAANCMKFRPESNGNSPGPPTSNIKRKIALNVAWEGNTLWSLSICTDRGNCSLRWIQPALSVIFPAIG